MRFEGVIKAWNDERGFGFIEPDQGGEEIFFHIKALAPRAARPQLNQRVSFEIRLNHEGKKRAQNVHAPRLIRVPRARQKSSATQWGMASIFAIPAFALVYFLVALAWRVPGWVAGLYVAASLFCFGAYAVDKSAAIAGRWRIAESHLLLLGLVGGWPGGIVAQQLLRHKSNKASFRSAFWACVTVNIVAFVAVHSPLAAAFHI